MERHTKALNERGTKTLVILLLIAASAGLAAFFHLKLNTDILYTHFFYIPIVLTSMWWGRRGIWVGFALAAIVIFFHLAGFETTGVANDLARTGFFLFISFFVGLLRDRVTASEKACLASEEKYRGLIEKSVAGIFVYNDDRILFANDRMGEMAGYDPGELVGMPMSELVLMQDRPKVKSLSTKLGNGGEQPLRYECRLVRKGGGTIWVDVASSLTEFEGAQAFLMNIYNITEGKEAAEKHRELTELAREQEAQLVHSTRLAELGEMAAGISHELNQPLTGIRNFAKNALYMIENNAGAIGDIKNNLRLISDQVDRASKIINKVREFTRRSELHFTSLDVNKVLKEAVDFLSPQMRLGGVRVALELDPNLPAITGDRIRLEQVFLNLITNAKQAMEEVVDRRLTVRSYYDSGSPCPVVVEIEDTGKGFDPRDREKLFAPFYTTKKSGHGTGLGLSISLSIIKDHGGYIKAAGKPGRGATFSVGLSIQQANPGEGAQRS